MAERQGDELEWSTNPFNDPSIAHHFSHVKCSEVPTIVDYAEDDALAYATSLRVSGTPFVVEVYILSLFFSLMIDHFRGFMGGQILLRVG